MRNGSNRITCLFAGLLLLHSGCALVPQPDLDADPRLDQLASKVDQSLENQAAVSQQLQQQQQQLERQQRKLQGLSDGIDRALGSTAEASCPEVAVCPPLDEAASKTIVGAIEDVWFSDLQLALTARVDTGAATSSLGARDIELFERDGKRWVRFDMINPVSKEPVMVKRRLRRTVAMVQTSTAVIRRPVVRMAIMIGAVSQQAEFIVTDQGHAKYPVRLGRNILKDVMVVDVSRQQAASANRFTESLVGAEEVR